MKFEKERLIKSPLNYTGGKYKLLPQILPLFPDNIDTFIDLFAGGCNVGVNVQANKIICNDYVKPLIDLYNEFKNNSVNEIYNYIFKIIEKYNNYKNPLDLYICICYSFNNQIRFNLNNKFNMPFGKNRSNFNQALQNRLKLFIHKLNNIEFTNISFEELNVYKLNKDDFVYCDPPYLVTCASYNENNGWNETKERELLNLLDNLHKNNIRFALSNVLENKGKSNDILKEWSKKYNIHHLNNTYGNCNYHTKDKGKNNTDEVLITNFDC